MQAKHTLELPLVREDEDNICLPLVVSVVSRYWGEEIPIAEAKEIAKLYPKIRGTIMIEGIQLAEKHGFRSFIYRGSLQDLKKRIDQGLPPIVILPGIRETVQHATVISGYDESTNRVLTYFPEPDKIGAIAYKQFNELWRQDDSITMMLVPNDMAMYVENDGPLFTNSNRVCFVAEKLHVQGKLDESLAMLLKAGKEEPKNPRVWHLLGSIYNDLGSEEAVRCYEQATNLNPKYYLAYRGTGNYYLKKKEYAKAGEYYSKAIEINPARFGPIYKNRAIARIETGDKNGGAGDLATYLEQCPDAGDRGSIEAMIKELGPPK
ncbi:MAG: tetratricopeptide repeat protein [Nitrososphaerales archaeon]